jgi:broad specificity phosphatase PhoE
VSFGHYWSDAPLTEYGHNMAHIKGQKLALEDFTPKHIYTSPYIRTMATATEIKKSFPQTEIIIEPLLAEYQPSNGHNIILYPNGIPTNHNGQETEFSFPETYEIFEKRIRFIISKLIEKNENDTIIITHGEILKTYTNYIQSMYPNLMLDPGTTPYLTTLSFQYDKINNKIVENTVKID